jgi:carbamoyl-phosphate synthase large subunit
MNVLLTCAGRRNYLVKFFREALRGRGLVFAADSSSDAPALGQADKSFIVPLLNHPAYIDVLLSICQRHRVRLLVPLNDLELQLLARHRARFLAVGTLPVISSPEVVSTCADKWETLNFLKACGLEIPNTFLSLADASAALARGDVIFPLVVKPRWGSASIGIEYSDDDEELELNYRLARKRLPRTFLREISATDPEGCVLIQERLRGEEYGLDVVNDLEGHHVCTFVKRKITMRAGETDRAVTVKSDWLEGVGEAIGRKLGHVGVLDCDAIVAAGNCHVLDLNPRFGGGYPFSHLAGANLPAVFVAWANREQLDPRWLKVKPNVMASKYDRLLVVGPQARVAPANDVPVQPCNAPSGSPETEQMPAGARAKASVASPDASEFVSSLSGLSPSRACKVRTRRLTENQSDATRHPPCE